MKRTLRRRRQLLAFSLVSALAVSVGAAPYLASSVSATTPPELEVQPLTGFPIDGALITYTPRPAMVVKIDNHPRAVPQSGLNQADVVFEEIVEGITRFAAVFNSQESNPVGPIRSGRTQDINLLSNLNDGTFVWSGGNDIVTAALQNTGMTLLGQGTEGFFRSGDRRSPHNLYANMEALWPQVGDSGNAVPIFEYTEMGADVGGSPVSFVEVEIAGRVRWDWNADTGLWMRSQRGDAHEATDGQVNTNNVVVVLTGYGSSAAGGVPEAVTIGSGEVVVYARGHKIEGTWTRTNPGDPWSLTDSSGNPILLQPGRTFVELVNGANFELTDG